MGADTVYFIELKGCVVNCESREFDLYSYRLKRLSELFLYFSDSPVRHFKLVPIVQFALYYSSLVFAESGQMEIIDAHIPICRTSHLKHSRLENCLFDYPSH